MKKQNNIRRIFEVTARLDKTFRPKLQEGLEYTNEQEPVAQEPGAQPGVKYRAEVTGIGENRWSTNAMEYDTEQQAKEWLDGLSGRWFGYDLSRVVPTTTPKDQPVDMMNDVIYQNFRRK